jgi:hypothetical protein
VILLSHVVRWADGSLPFSQIDAIRIAEAPLIIMPLAFFHYLNRHARRSFGEFRPALPDDETHSPHLLYQLTTTPARGGFIASATGAAIGLLSLAGDPDGYGITPDSSTFTFLYTAALASFSFVFIAMFAYQTVRQLQLVNRLHRLASNVSLFELRPIYAFSSLTARTGIGILFFVYYGTLVISYANVGSPTPMSPQDLAVFGLVLVLAGASFVMPLLGIHRRLSEEKERLLADVDQRMQIALQVIHHQVDARNFERMDDLNKALASLVTERELLHKTSTWPWRPETLRAFASAVALPVAIWLATALLARFLGL